MDGGGLSEASPSSAGTYVASATGLKCDYCSGFMPASQDVWIFLHRGAKTRLFCSSACCAGYALTLSDGLIANAGRPWARYQFGEVG